MKAYDVKETSVTVIIPKSLPFNYHFFVFNLSKNNELYYTFDFNKIKIIELKDKIDFQQIPELDFILSKKDCTVNFFLLGGPEIDYTFYENCLYNLNKLRFITTTIYTASKWSINTKFHLYNSYLQTVFLSESVRQFIYKRNTNVYFGGWRPIDSLEHKLYLIKNELRERFNNRSSFGLFEMQEKNFINHLKKEDLFCELCSEIKNIDAHLTDMFLMYLMSLVIHPRYFIISPYLYNFVKIYNYLGLVKFDILDGIYKNKLPEKSYKFKLATREFLLDNLLGTAKKQTLKDKDRIKLARKKLWPILSMWLKKSIENDRRREQTATN